MLHPDIKNYVSVRVRKKQETDFKRLEKIQQDKELSLDEQLEHDVLSEALKRIDVSESDCKEWILEILKIASQRQFATHVPKFIHPDAIVSYPNIIHKYDPDGYIRTGNIPEYMDSYRNAGAMAATDFMSILVDDMPLYKHISESSLVAEDFFSFIGTDCSEAREILEGMIKANLPYCTDSRLRQVFFPLEDGSYHLITPLYSSSLIYSFNQTLIKNKEYNNNPGNVDENTPMSVYEYERKNLYLENGYWELPNLVDISYGGSKPQNISFLNSLLKRQQLIKSVPPKITNRKIRIPKSNFFYESINQNKYKAMFEKIHAIFNLDINNIRIRNARDNCLLNILGEIALDIASVRYEIEKNTIIASDSLSVAQEIMLFGKEERYENSDWQSIIAKEFSKWFFTTYKKLIKNAIRFGDAEFNFIEGFAIDHKEVFIQ